MTVEVYVDWRQRARCRQVDPDHMYPAHDADGTAAAKAVCRRCPVKAECLADALKHDERHGVWGGMTPAERRNLQEKGVAKRHVPRRVECPECGRALSLRNAVIRSHNWLRDGRKTPCPGSGTEP